MAFCKIFKKQFIFIKVPLNGRVFLTKKDCVNEICFSFLNRYWGGITIKIPNDVFIYCDNLMSLVCLCVKPTNLRLALIIKKRFEKLLSLVICGLFVDLKIAGTKYKIVSVDEGMVFFELGKSHLVQLKIPENLEILVLNKAFDEFRVIGKNLSELGLFVFKIINLYPYNFYTHKGFFIFRKSYNFNVLDNF